MLNFFDLSPASDWWGWLLHSLSGDAMRRQLLFVAIVAGVLLTFMMRCNKKDEPAVKTSQQEALTEPKAEMPSELLPKYIQTSGHPDVRFQVPTFEQLKSMNAQFVRIEVAPDLSGLSTEEMQCLTHLVAAADILDDIYWDQNTVDGKKFRDMCRVPGMKSDYDQALCDYIMLNYGRYDRRTHEAFIKLGVDDSRPEWGTFYPPNVPKQAIEAWADGLYDEMQKQIKSPYTVIQAKELLPDGYSLEVVPYNLAYKDRLEAAATQLELAADYADSAEFALYLRTQAQAFRDNDYTAADTAWVQVKDSGWLVVMGPYEVYDDLMFNWKAAYEAYIGRIDVEMTAGMSQIDEHRAEIEAALPLDKKFVFKKSGIAPVIVTNAVYNAGQAGAGVQFSAFKLPNDEAVTANVGSKNVMNMTAQRAKFKIGMQPIAERVLVPEQRPLVSWTAYSWHNITHELGHGMGPGQITLADGRQSTVGVELKDLSMPIEEAKADILGFWMIPFMVKYGILPESALDESAATSLAGFFRSVRFGLHEAHARANLLAYNYLKQAGVYQQDAQSGLYSVMLDKFYPAVEQMLGELLLIEAQGDYAAAQAFMDKYGGIPKEVDRTVRTLTDLPIDIRPEFTTARLYGAQR